LPWSEADEHGNLRSRQWFCGVWSWSALRLSSLIFATLALIPTGAHLFEMANKLKLDQVTYLAAQRSYDGWNLFGIAILGALLSTFALAIASYRQAKEYFFSGLAFVCLAATQVIFWAFTLPMNQATNNRTTLPVNWEELRRQWEFSHAASAVLNFLALVLLFLAVLSKADRADV